MQCCSIGLNIICILLIVVLKYSQNIAGYFYPLETPHLKPMTNFM